MDDKQTPPVSREGQHLTAQDVDARMEDLKEKAYILKEDLMLQLKRVHCLAQELKEARERITVLEDVVESQKRELARRQEIIDEASKVSKVIASLLDADSGADLHDITAHVTRLFDIKSK